MCVCLHAYISCRQTPHIIEHVSTHPGVSGLLELLCNGLVGRHDNEHLDTHVEDAHWDQVGHVVSMEKHTQKAIKLCSYRGM